MSRWDERCAQILRRMAGHYHDEQIATHIEGETGKRFTVKVIQRYRLAAGLDACRRNYWTAPLSRAQAA